METENMRASDADRDRVAERLREAHTHGRISAEELEERLDVLYRAKKLGELSPLTDDLPSVEESAAPIPTDHLGSLSVAGVSSDEARRLATESQGRENLVAIFGGAERKGRWLVEPRINASILCGGITLDLREAVLVQREVSVQCAVILGGLEVTIPPGVRVVNHTSAVLGGVDTHGADGVTDPNAPTIRLTGTCLLGGVAVKVKSPKPTKST